MLNVNLFNNFVSINMHSLPSSNPVTASEKINNEESKFENIRIKLETDETETELDIDDTETEFEGIETDTLNHQKNPPKRKKKIYLKNKIHKFITEKLAVIEGEKYSDIQAVAKEIHHLLQQEFGEAPSIKYLQSHFSTNNTRKCKNETDNCAQKIAGLIDKNAKALSKQKETFKWTDEIHQFVSTKLDKIEKGQYPDIQAIAKYIHLLLKQNFGNAPAIFYLQGHFSINNTHKCKNETDNCAQKIAELVKKKSTTKQKKGRFCWTEERHQFVRTELDKIKEEKYPNINAVAIKLHPLLKQEFGIAPAVTHLHSHLNTNHSGKCKNETDNCAQKVAKLIEKKCAPRKNKAQFRWTEEIHQFVITELDRIKEGTYRNISAVAKYILLLLQQEFGNAPALRYLMNHFSEKIKHKCKNEIDNCAEKVAKLINKN